MRMHWILYATLALCLAGCYTFSGSTLPGHLKTIRVVPVQDQTLHPELAERLTQRLMDGFQARTSLRIVNDQPHCEITVVLKNYSHTAYNTSGSSVLDYQINMGVSVRFYDRVKDKMLYEENNLPGFATYSVNKGQSEAIGQDEAITRVVELVLDNTVSVW